MTASDRIFLRRHYQAHRLLCPGSSNSTCLAFSRRMLRALSWSATGARACGRLELAKTERARLRGAEGGRGVAA